MNRLVPSCVALALVLGTGCARPWSPPPRASPLPRPIIYVQTPNGRVPMTPEQAAEYDAATTSRASVQTDDPPMSLEGQYSGTSGPLPRIPVLEGLSRPDIHVDAVGPVTPTFYYVRGEHTSSGYIEGRYGRVDNFTPGEHTSAGYIPGHYRGDGALNYTRPEHTSTGYIPGHYRAEPLPFGQPAGAVHMSPAATAPLTFNRPLGG